MIANVITTHTCNLRCKHCYMGDDLTSSNFENVLPHWKEVLRKAPELNIDKFIFTGGEVTTCSQILELLKLCSDYNISLFSNGITMPDDVINCCNEFWISLDGPEQIHNQIRSNCNAFYRTWDSCMRIKKYGKKLHIQTTINKININYLEALLPIYKKLLPALDSISLVCVVNKGNTHFNKLTLNTSDLQKVKQFKEYVAESLYYKVFIKDNLYTYALMEQFVLNERATFPLWIDLITMKAFVLIKDYEININEISIKWYYEQIQMLKNKLLLYLHEHKNPDRYYNIEDILVL